MKFIYLRRGLVCQRSCLCLIVGLLTLVCAAAQAQSASTETFELPNGLTVVVRNNDFSDLVAVNMMLGISVMDEPETGEGIRSLLQEMLLRRENSRQTDLHAWGAELEAEASTDFVEFNAVAPAAAFEAIVEALRRTVAGSADFSQAEAETAKNARLLYLQATAGEPFHTTYRLFRENLYGDHPYARTIEGRVRSIRSISVREVKDFYSDWYRPDNAVIAVSGNVTSNHARAVIEKTFADWARTHLPTKRRDFDPPVLKSSIVGATEGPSPRAHLVIGFPAPSAQDRVGFAAFQVMNSLLNRETSGRLVTSLRDRRGLAYEISPNYPVVEGPSHLAVYVACDWYEVEEVKTLVLEEFNRLLTEPVPDSELASAKRYLLGRYAISLQRNRQQAYNLAWYRMQGWGENPHAAYRSDIQAISADTLRQQAREYLNHMVVAVTLPRG